VKRRRILLAALALLALAAVAAFALWRGALAKRENARRIAARANMYRSMGIFAPGTEEFVALPPETPHRPAAASLGMKLFADRRIAQSSKRACVSCHPPGRGGADDKVHGGLLTRSVQNAAFASCYMHDGSVASLAAAIERMAESPAFGACPLSEAVARLSRDQALSEQFAAVYKTGISASNIVDAIEQHLRARVTPSGAFDRHLSGKPGAFAAAQTRGFAVFKAAGCVQCHGGPALGGRAVHAGKKVPALRGLARRSVFLQDGSATDVPTALMRMPVADLSDDDRSALVSFLEAL